MGNARVKYFENLDGFRFLFFLSVFLFHSFHTRSPEIINSDAYFIAKKCLVSNGNLGVNAFFVLSGFLITYLLVFEKIQFGNISVFNFWVKRSLRIWPLFYFCVFFGFVIFPVVKSLFGQVSVETADWRYYVTFLNNFDFIHKGFPDSSVLGVLWSLAVEEQFYFVWPLIFYFSPVRLAWIPMVLVVIVSIFFRFKNITNGSMLEFHTLSCIGDMAIGSLGAWLIATSTPFLNKIKHLPRSLIYFVYLALFSILFFKKQLFDWDPIVLTFQRLVIAVLVLFVILEQSFAVNSFYKMSKFSLLTRLGKITFGLYCFHFIGILITLQISQMLGTNKFLFGVLGFETILSLAISIAIATISYKYFEAPILGLKKKIIGTERD